MDPFATLGVPARFDLDPAEIERRYRDLQRTLHPDRNVGKPAPERRVALGKAVEVNEAYRTLRDDLSRARALLAARGVALDERAPADPALLMEVMERREQLSEARSDLARVRALGDEVRADLDRARARLVALFERGEDRAAADEVGRMRYHRRFLDEVEAIEEDALGPPRS